MPSRRCVAMTFQPFAAYCLTNSRPKPEFAPVISTVSASAADGTASVQPMSSAAPSASAERLSIAIPPRCRVALWYRLDDHCGAPAMSTARPCRADSCRARQVLTCAGADRAAPRRPASVFPRAASGDAERRRERAGRAGRRGEQLPRSHDARGEPEQECRAVRRHAGTRSAAARRRLPSSNNAQRVGRHMQERRASSAARPKRP